MLFEIQRMLFLGYGHMLAIFLRDRATRNKHLFVAVDRYR